MIDVDIMYKEAMGSSASSLALVLRPTFTSNDTHQVHILCVLS